MSQNTVRLTQPLLGRRRDARLRVEMRARLITHEGAAVAVLADVARQGARIYAPDCNVKVGRQAILAWDRFEAFGDVVWAHGSFIGLRFDEPLDREVLLATRVVEDSRLMPLERQLMREAAQSFVNPRYKT